MASRRIISSEKTLLEMDEADARSPAASEPSSITPAVPTHVIAKLLAFTAAMVVGPIATYFLTLHGVFRGNSTYAGAAAALVANVVLVAYVVVAMREDQSEALARLESERAQKNR